ncbi:MAG: hypothetical protein JRI52_03545 [Deltaproteobacteria bacterium]|nr:hypothetical protein [Deltaproteobacteria bacterium]
MPVKEKHVLIETIDVPRFQRSRVGRTVVLWRWQDWIERCGLARSSSSAPSVPVHVLDLHVQVVLREKPPGHKLVGLPQRTDMAGSVFLGNNPVDCLIAWRESFPVRSVLVGDVLEPPGKLYSVHPGDADVLFNLPGRIRRCRRRQPRGTRHYLHNIRL